MKEDDEKSNDNWSLYKRNDDEGGLFDYSGDKLAPLEFTNGKTQEGVVKEILDKIKEGNKIIFVHGVCGTGKSAIALNLAKNFKRTSIVVPIKSLQEQYEQDYSQKKFILKENKKPLTISVIKGRNNFRCTYAAGERANEPTLPCIIEIRDKNTRELLNYIGENPETSVEDFSSATDIKRMNIAPACPYWSPLMPAEINPKGLGEYEKIKFPTISGKDFALFQRKKGCPYYDQYRTYATSDVLIFNSTKYLIESALGRKPLTDIEVIDECDEFLDSFANERKITINRLVTALSNLAPNTSERKQAVKDLIQKLNYFLFESKSDIDCEKVEKTDFNEIMELILENPNLAEDEEFNYYNTAVEIARSFSEIIGDTYISIQRFKREEGQDNLFGAKKSNDEQVYVTLVSINLAEKFKELLEANKVFVMMSGTLHSSEVLRDIFGLTDFKIVEAETKMPGEVKKVKTGIERNCSYANFQNGSISRKQYLKILDHCVGQSEKPVLVHVNAFADLPKSQERTELHLENLMTQEELKEEQKDANMEIELFHKKKKEILFTTKCSRGVDFAGDKCRSIIMTRFPYPNISGLFWKILKKEQPNKFMEFYMDKARRELRQKVARGVRYKGDWVKLLSPDIRVLNCRLD